MDGSNGRSRQQKYTSRKKRGYIKIMASPQSKRRFVMEAKNHMHRTTHVMKVQKGMHSTDPIVRNSSPFRNIMASSSPSSREGRLGILLKDFNEKSLQPSTRKVEDVISSFYRSTFLPKEDIVMLESVLQKNKNFMSNVETILNEAVIEQSPMEQCSVRAAYDNWSKVNMINIKIQKVLESLNPAKSPSSSRTPTRRVSSPTARTLGEVRFQRVSSPIRAGRGGADNGKLDRLLLLSDVSCEEVKEIQSLLIQKFGETQGRTRFLTWLADLPLSTLKRIQSELPDQ